MPGIEIALGRSVQGVQLEIVIAQRGADFAHGFLRTVIEMAARAKNLDGAHAGARDVDDHRGRQFALDEKISGKGSRHRQNS